MQGQRTKKTTIRNTKCPISAFFVWDFKCLLPQFHALLPYTNHPTYHGGFSALEDLSVHSNPSLPCPSPVFVHNPQRIGVLKASSNKQKCNN